MKSTRTTEAWQKIDASHHIHPFTDSHVLAKEGSRVIVRGDGVELEDSDGNRFIDAMAGLWCVQIGHGRHELADAAHAQMRELLEDMRASIERRERDAFLGLSETLLVIMQQHNAKEEQILYRMADQVLGESVPEVIDRMAAVDVRQG